MDGMNSLGVGEPFRAFCDGEEKARVEGGSVWIVRQVQLVEAGMRLRESCLGAVEYVNRNVLTFKPAGSDVRRTGDEFKETWWRGKGGA